MSIANISIVTPVYNEEETVDAFVESIDGVFRSCDDVNVEIIFVNDGSTDGTLEKILKMHGSGLGVKLVDLSRNFGKEAALTAGMFEASGDAVIVIDVDLQDPPELIPEMIEKWRAGYEVVVGRRVNRDSDSWAKRTSAEMFYKFHNVISSTQIPNNAGDFRLMDRCVIEALKQLPESHRFMKGLFAWVGFRTAFIDYSRPKRNSGASKFNGLKLWSFAVDGITSFSIAPLRLWVYLGIAVAFPAFLFAMFIVFRVLVSGADVPGYASLMVAITFIGGVQLIGIGVIGEYVGRTYIESKRRPNYIVRRVYQAHEPGGT
ncbi:MAG: glycosyltransferase family 2 protein [Alphaproteobacteria bacterium]|nr:glycosyltransferase family 2 protein [Alphaproteobacteria bacterium]MBF0249122.1 glycosyltransferase family 2 protein [Alphaproteobacteria bacterium]